MAEGAGWGPVAARPLGLQASAALCAAWVVAWLASHCVWQALCHPRDAYSRRLWRSQAYCCLALAGAARLLTRCRRLPEDLLFDFSAEHQVLFSMAVGHWLVSILEDCRSWSSLGRGLDKKVLRVRDPSLFLLRAYTAHHLVAAAGYFCLLRLRRCAGVGTLGLLFELPVLLLNHRELALGRSPVPRWLRQRSGVAAHWRHLSVLFLAGRGGPILLYLYSLVFWRAQLAQLTLPELAVYHGMPIFFALLNYAFVTVLLAWARSDVDAAALEARAEEAEAPDGGEAGEEGFEVDPGAVPLREVLPETVASMTGAQPGCPLWVAVDGAAYDITAFLPDCPCGEEVLRRWAGRDATEAFRAAAHSRGARARMLRYMVGPIKYPHTEYRLFEHDEEEHPVLRVVACTTFGYVLKVAAISGLLLNGDYTLAGASGGAAVSSLDLALLSLLLAAASGGLAILSSAVVASRTKSAPSWGWGEHAFALCLLLYHGCFLSGCRGPPPGFPSGAPGGLELCAAALLAFEAALERPSVPDFDKSVGFWGAAAAVFYSWVCRVTATPPQESWSGARHRYASVLEGYAELCLRALALAAALRLLLLLLRRGAGRGGRGRGDEDLAAIAARGLRLSGVYGALGLLVLTTASPAAGDRLSALVAQPGPLAARLLACGAAALALLAGLLGAASQCSAAFAGRLAAFSLAAVSFVLSGLGGRRWLAVLGFVAHLAGLAARNRLRLREAADAKRFGDVPRHVIGAQALWDHFRVALGSFIWRATVLRWQALLNGLLPRELRFFASETAFPNVGRPEDKTYLGVAAHFAPRKARGQKQMPQYFVCNVGQIYHAALSDMQRTMNTLIDVWQEFQEPDMKGLLANVVAIFPDVEDQMVAKEINLSAWESAKDAHAWYVKSPGHKNALFQHSSGILRTFGNLLASLEPLGPSRHQDRCRHCARVVEAREAGQLAPSRCRVCGGPTFQYPVF